MAGLRVYLCGPLDSQAGDRDLKWRRDAEMWLASLGAKPINPIRNFGTIAAEEQTLTPNEIVTRDRRDALSSDVLLVNLTSDSYPSIGTASEMAWAWERGIPIIAIWPHERRVPVFLRHFAARIFGDPDTPGVDEAGDLWDAVHYVVEHWKQP